MTFTASGAERAPPALPWWRAFAACEATLLMALNLFWARLFEPLTRYAWADRLYALGEFYFYYGRFADLKRPRSYSERMLELKLNELRDPLRQYVTDKEHLRAFVRTMVGERYNVRPLAILRSPEEVAAFDFPPRCVIKPTHSSGRHILRRSARDAVDRDAIIAWFSHNYYPRKREPNYRQLEPKVIVEDVLSLDGRLLDDYKIHCFHGRPKLIHVMRNRLTGIVAGAMFSDKWQALPFTIQRYCGAEISRPVNLDEVVGVAARLSAPFSYLRVDLYTDGSRVYVGELTNLPGGATLSFQPPRADELTGRFFDEPDLDPVEVYAALH
jgi:hypothetical protein